jgi:hypothetical protein
VNKWERQCGKDIDQAFGRVALVVIVDHILQPDAVASDVNVAVGVLSKKFGQVHEFLPFA